MVTVLDLNKIMKGCHRFFHLNNISRAFSPRSQWHYPKSITCNFFQSMRRHFSPEKCLAANNILLMRKRKYPFLHFAIFLAWKKADRFASRRHSWKKQTRWSNDKTIIKLGHRKISWFVSVSQISYLPKPKAEANN